MRTKRGNVHHRSRVTKCLIDTLVEFAENTSIHGVKYVVKKNTGFVERILWLLIVFLGVLGSVYMFILFWHRYTSNPTRTQVATAYAPTIYFPFPAITICNINQLIKRKTQNFVSKLELNGYNESEVMEWFYPLMNLNKLADLSETHFDNLENLQRLLELNDFNYVRSIIKRLGQTCKEMLIKCKWQARTVKCTDFFVETYTRDGICCSFNNYDKRKGGGIYKTYFYGFQMGLTVLLDPMTERYTFNQFISRGVTVTIHNPTYHLGVGSTSKVLTTGRESVLQLSGIRYTCSPDVAHVSIENRKCVYSWERSLQYFPEYSESNCIVECRAKYVLKQCNCVPFYYTFTEDIVCNLTRIRCVHEATVDYVDLNCNCLPLCEDATYEVMSSSSKIYINKQISTSTFLSDVNATDNSVLLHVFFSSQTQTVLQRNTLTSPVYLFSSLGGIFSLFLGCSFISGIEIFYYLVIRLPINLRALKRVQSEKTKSIKTVLPAHDTINDHFKFRQEIHTNSNKSGGLIYTIHNENVFIN